MSIMSPNFPARTRRAKRCEEARANLKEAVALLIECYREEAEKDLSATALKEDLILQAA